MKRILALVVLMVFGIAQIGVASTVALTDADLDGVSAGEWVVLNEGSGNESVADVYTTNNTLWLLENSQKDIQVVSNANVIDSAAAVQNNIAGVTGDATENVAVNGSNSATINNYRPASSKDHSTSESSTLVNEHSTTSGSSSSESCELNIASGETSSTSASSSSSAALVYDETLNIVGAIAGSAKSIDKNGIGGSAIAGSLVVDYDKTILATEASASASASDSSKAFLLGSKKESSSSSYGTDSTKVTESRTSESKCVTRDSKGANNHILLDATSQQSIQAVSNLNAVGAGVAVQNNIANNVGVSGSISGSNSANVSSGF